MATVLFSERGLADLDRLADFLAREQPDTADATATLIRQALGILESHPLMGRDAGGGTRELVISRGASGYAALYTFDEGEDRIVVQTIRHQREAGAAD